MAADTGAAVVGLSPLPRDAKLGRRPRRGADMRSTRLGALAVDRRAGSPAAAGAEDPPFVGWSALLPGALASLRPVEPGRLHRGSRPVRRSDDPRDDARRSGARGVVRPQGDLLPHVSARDRGVPADGRGAVLRRHAVRQPRGHVFAHYYFSAFDAWAAAQPPRFRRHGASRSTPRRRRRVGDRRPAARDQRARPARPPARPVRRSASFGPTARAERPTTTASTSSSTASPTTSSPRSPAASTRRSTTPTCRRASTTRRSSSCSPGGARRRGATRNCSRRRRRRRRASSSSRRSRTTRRPRPARSRRRPATCHSPEAAAPRRVLRRPSRRPLGAEGRRRMKPRCRCTTVGGRATAWRARPRRPTGRAPSGATRSTFTVRINRFNRPCLAQTYLKSLCDATHSRRRLRGERAGRE